VISFNFLKDIYNLSHGAGRAYIGTFHNYRPPERTPYNRGSQDDPALGCSQIAWPFNEQPKVFRGLEFFPVFVAEGKDSVPFLGHGLNRIKTSGIHSGIIRRVEFQFYLKIFVFKVSGILVCHGADLRNCIICYEPERNINFACPFQKLSVHSQGGLKAGPGFSLRIKFRHENLRLSRKGSIGSRIRTGLP
jgi:hypothetical protein